VLIWEGVGPETWPCQLLVAAIQGDRVDGDPDRLVTEIGVFDSPEAVAPD